MTKSVIIRMTLITCATMGNIDAGMYGRSRNALSCKVSFIGTETAFRLVTVFLWRVLAVVHQGIALVHHATITIQANVPASRQRSMTALAHVFGVVQVEVVGI